MWGLFRSRPRPALPDNAAPLLRAVLRDNGSVEGMVISSIDLSGKLLEFRAGEEILGRAMLGAPDGQTASPFKAMLTLDGRAAVDIFLMPDGMRIGGVLAAYRRPSSEDRLQPAATDAPIEILKVLSVHRGGEVALFVTHSATGSLKPNLLPYLRAIRAAGVAVQLIVVVDRPVAVSADVLELVDGAVVRRNCGYDFAAWAHVLALMPELYGASTLYLLNDSVIASARAGAVADLFDRVRAVPADLVGLTASLEYRWHLQSYFLAIRSRLLASVPFQEFIRDIRIIDDKDAVVRAYELRLTEHIENAGFTAHALFDVGTAGNPVVLGWRALIDDGFPFVKVNLLAGRQAEGVPEGWPAVLEDAGFDLEVVRRTLAAIDAPVLPREGDFLLDRPAMPDSADRPLRIAYIGPWNRDGAQGAAARRFVAALRRTSHALNLLPFSSEGRQRSPDHEIRSFVGRADIVIADVPAADLTLLDAIDAVQRVWLRSADDIPPDLAVDAIWSCDPDASSDIMALAPHLLSVETPVGELADWIERALDTVRGEGRSGPSRIISTLNAGLPPDLLPTLDDFEWIILGEDGVPPSSLPPIEAAWVGIVTKGALLSPTFHADLRAEALARPDANIFYADDLAIGMERAIDQLRLKPEFDRTLLRSQDYIGVPLIVRGSALAALGGLREGMGSAALIDLVLRADAAGLGIARIPKVLMATPGSRLIAESTDHARAVGPSAQVRIGPVAILIPTRRAPVPEGGGTYVERLLGAIAQVDWPMDKLTVIVGDDIADRPDWADRDWPFTLNWMATPRGADEPFNYAAKMNRLARAAACEQLIFLNDDVWPLGPGWLAALQLHATDPAVGGVGAHLLFPDGRLQHAGMAPQGGAVSHLWFGRADREGTYQDWGRVAREWSMVTGAVFATRTSLLDEVGGFDEQFSLEYNDTDLCLRLRSLGYRIICTPDALFEHAEKASRGQTPPPGEEVARFLARWSYWLKEDPHWHPGLRRDRLEMQPRIDPDAWYL